MLGTKPPRMIMMNRLILISVTILAFVDIVFLEDSLKVGESCFCKLKGEIDDCSCSVESVDSFNNLKVYPRLNSLLSRDYFRFWRANLQKECRFWADDGRCSLKDCHVNGCSEDELPDGLKQNGSKPKNKNKYSAEAQEEASCDDEKLGDLDRTISAESQQAFQDWKEHDDAQENFCELDDDNSVGLTYVDLTLNPERYTGYKGKSPHRIWSSIYEENCFTAEKREYTYIMQRRGSSADEGLCLEKRAFYRLISGLHSSINIHLSAMYLFQDKLGLVPDRWAPNVEEFLRRFGPTTTDGRGPQWLKNLYFTYLVELRALAKAAPYLEQEVYYTGNEKEDQEVKDAVLEMLKIVKTFPNHFDESRLFRSDREDAADLKKEFKEKFMNISRIMDCVGCDKCKLWGKLQVTGLGTALKILFSGDSMSPDSTVTQDLKHRESLKFQLRRQEIVALFNAFGRLSRSIHEVEMFRSYIKE